MFVNEIYKIRNDWPDKTGCAVVDIGANHGYTALWFACKDWCPRVFAFELTPDNYQSAMRNLVLNPQLAEKICLQNYGLGNSNETVTAMCHPHSTGTSSMKKMSLTEGRDGNMSVDCQIKKASEALNHLADDDGKEFENFILKIDVEGAEYDIMRNLAAEYPEFLQKTKLIIGETHRLVNEPSGLEEFLQILHPFSFECLRKEQKGINLCEFELVNMDAHHRQRSTVQSSTRSDGTR